MNPNHVRVLTIIITHNGSKWIQKTIEAVQNSDFKYEILVIDNASSDNSLERIKSNFEDVELIALEKNIGFGAANNIGIVKGLKSDFDYFFLVNQDVYVSPTTISSLLNEFDGSKFGILSPIHLNGEGSKLDLNFSKQCSPYYCPDFLSDTWTGNLKRVYEIEFVNAACWMVSRKCVEEIGLFEELFFMYGEDVNFIHRCKYHGIKVGIIPSDSIRHDREERKGAPSISSIHHLNCSDFLRVALNINEKPFWKTIKVILSSIKKYIHSMNFGGAFKYLNFILRHSFQVIKKRKSYKTKMNVSDNTNAKSLQTTSN